VPKSGTFNATPFEWIDPKLIPKRQWLYRPHYIREFLSLLFSSGGKGKSSLLITESLAMVSGKPLLGIHPGAKLHVWYWNGEDPALELQRRFAAAIKHYELKPEDIGDRLFVDSGRTLPIIVAEEGRYGTYVCEPIVDDVIATLRNNHIDVLIVDPFVSCHRVAENDNSAIERVAKTWAEIAEATNCSILAAHHTRKSVNGTDERYELRAYIEAGSGPVTAGRPEK
jgi:RecA-family ATPase